MSGKELEEVPTFRWFFISVILNFQGLNINHAIGIVSEFSKWQDCAHSTFRNESYLRAKPTGSKNENH